MNVQQLDNYIHLLGFEPGQGVTEKDNIALCHKLANTKSLEEAWYAAAAFDKEHNCSWGEWLYDRLGEYSMRLQ